MAPHSNDSAYVAPSGAHALYNANSVRPSVIIARGMRDVTEISESNGTAPDPLANGSAIANAGNPSGTGCIEHGGGNRCYPMPAFDVAYFNSLGGFSAVEEPRVWLANDIEYVDDTNVDVVGGDFTTLLFNGRDFLIWSAEGHGSRGGEVISTSYNGGTNKTRVTHDATGVDSADGPFRIRYTRTQAETDSERLRMIGAMYDPTEDGMRYVHWNFQGSSNAQAYKGDGGDWAGSYSPDLLAIQFEIRVDSSHLYTANPFSSSTRKIFRITRGTPSNEFPDDRFMDFRASFNDTEFDFLPAYLYNYHTVGGDGIRYVFTGPDVGIWVRVTIYLEPGLCRVWYHRVSDGFELKAAQEVGHFLLESTPITFTDGAIQPGNGHILTGQSSGATLKYLRGAEILTSGSWGASAAGTASAFAVNGTFEAGELLDNTTSTDNAVLRISANPAPMTGKATIGSFRMQGHASSHTATNAPGNPYAVENNGILHVRNMIIAADDELPVT